MKDRQNKSHMGNVELKENRQNRLYKGNDQGLKTTEWIGWQLTRTENRALEILSLPPLSKKN